MASGPRVFVVPALIPFAGWTAMVAEAVVPEAVAPEAVVSESAEGNAGAVCAIDPALRIARAKLRTGQVLADDDAGPAWKPGDCFGERFGGVGSAMGGGK